MTLRERIGTFILKIISIINIKIQRVTKGKWAGSFIGRAPIGVLTTTGRKSGLAREAALMFYQDGDDVVVVASKFGMPHNPAWYLNILDDAHVSFEWRAVKRPYRARVANETERARLWPELVRHYGHYEKYQARAPREIPVVICSPVS
ncbi:MAG: nitroreductase/quinone reductase family protein [Acidimicrobiia bacterium]